MTISTDVVQQPLRIIGIRHLRLTDNFMGYPELVHAYRRKGHKNSLPNFYRARGGVTVVTVTDGQKNYTGLAVCSKQDVYCKHVGILYATRRAEQAALKDVPILAPKARLFNKLTEDGWYAIMSAIDPRKIIKFE